MKPEASNRPVIQAKGSLLSKLRGRVLARQMEVYAGMAEHTDYEIGRLIQAIEDLGELDNTLVAWVAGDNGGSPFGGPIGSFNQLATFNGVPTEAHRRSGWADSQWALRHAMGPGELHADGGRAGAGHIFRDTQRHRHPLAEGNHGQG